MTTTCSPTIRISIVPARISSGDALPERPRGRLRSRLDIELRKDVGQMTRDRLLADEELIGNLAVRQSSGNLTEHFHLTPGQDIRHVGVG